LAVMTQYDVIKSVNIRSIQWGNDYVIYDQLSGDTHLLDSLSGELIVALSLQAMSWIELLKKLDQLFEEATGLEMENYLLDFIDKFQKLGLLDIE
jgi:PqqD family protein of HPr-rel-A system